jgi:hypothetical protein
MALLLKIFGEFADDLNEVAEIVSNLRYSPGGYNSEQRVRLLSIQARWGGGAVMPIDKSLMSVDFSLGETLMYNAQEFYARLNTTTSSMFDAASGALRLVMSDVQDPTLSIADTIAAGKASITPEVVTAAERLEAFYSRINESFKGADYPARDEPSIGARAILSRVRQEGATVMHDLSPDRTLMGVDDSLGKLRDPVWITKNAVLNAITNAGSGIGGVLDINGFAGGNSYFIRTNEGFVYVGNNPGGGQVNLFDMTNMSGSRVLFSYYAGGVTVAGNAVAGAAAANIQFALVDAGGNPIANSVIRTVNEGLVEVAVPSGIASTLQVGAIAGAFAIKPIQALDTQGGIGNRSATLRNGNQVTTSTKLIDAVGNLAFADFDLVLTHENTKQFLRFVRALAASTRGRQLQDYLQSWWDLQVGGAFVNRRPGDVAYAFQREEVNSIGWWFSTPPVAITLQSFKELYRRAFGWWLVDLQTLDTSAALRRKLIADLSL